MTIPTQQRHRAAATGAATALPSLSSSFSVLLLINLLLLPIHPTSALHQDSGPPATECQWSNVVHFGQSCTGSYLGNGLVVSAAQCENPTSVKFGEVGGDDFDVDPDDLGWFAVAVSSCQDHPSYVSSTGTGVDVKWCTLDPEDANFDKLTNVPVVYPMVPTGCQRDWLSDLIYNRYRCPGASSTKWSCNDAGPPVAGIGVGCNDAECVEDDVKRYPVPPFRLVRQENHHGDPTSLFVYDDAFGGGVMSGDNGGPLVVELPDGTFRQVGVLHSYGSPNGAHYAGLPARLRWIEMSSGKDVTPCHDWIDDGSGGSYSFLGGEACDGVHPVRPHVPPPEATWNATVSPEQCSTNLTFASYASTDGECQWNDSRRRRDLTTTSRPGPGGFMQPGSSDTGLFENEAYTWQAEQKAIAAHFPPRKRGGRGRGRKRGQKQGQQGGVRTNPGVGVGVGHGVGVGVSGGMASITMMPMKPVDKCAGGGWGLGNTKEQHLLCEPAAATASILSTGDAGNGMGDGSVKLEFGVAMNEATVTSLPEVPAPAPALPVAPAQTKPPVEPATKPPIPDLTPSPTPAPTPAESIPVAQDQTKPPVETLTILPIDPVIGAPDGGEFVIATEPPVEPVTKPPTPAPEDESVGTAGAGEVGINW